MYIYDGREIERRQTQKKRKKNRECSGGGRGIKKKRNISFGFSRLSRPIKRTPGEGSEIDETNCYTVFA